MYVCNHLRRAPRVLTNPANHLACAHCSRKISALRGPKNCIEETVSPCCIIRRSWRSHAFFSRRNGGSLAPIGKELVQFHNVRGVTRCSGHICAQASGSNHREWRNISSNVEREHAPAQLIHRRRTDEEMHAKRITDVPHIRIVFVKSVILAGVNVDGSRVRQTSSEGAQRSRDHERE